MKDPHNHLPSPSPHPQMLMKYGDLRYAPREMARGVDLKFAGGEVEGLLKDSDKYSIRMNVVRYLLLPLSLCPRPTFYTVNLWS